MASTTASHSISSTEGRKYHKDEASAYVLPNDAPEHDRLEMQAQLLEGVMYGDVIHAPLDPVKATRCLDVGCGTGYVTNAMARKFPQAEVVGLDLSPVPNVRQWEPNVNFFQGNVLTQNPSQWRAADEHSMPPQEKELFDLCFHRLLLMGMTDWPGFFRREFELLKPGGWAECHEIDSVLCDRDGQEILTDTSWHKTLIAGMEALRLDHRAGSHAAQKMEEAGFVDIEVVKYRLPLGGKSERTPFLRKAGDFWAKGTREVIPLSTRRVMSVRGASEDEIKGLVKEFEETFPMDGVAHSVFFVTYGRKPE